MLCLIFYLVLRERIAKAAAATISCDTLSHLVHNFATDLKLSSFYKQTNENPLKVLVLYNMKKFIYLPSHNK